MKRVIRFFFGLVILLSIFWIGFGFFATGESYQEVVTEAGESTEDEVISAYEAGAGLATGVSYIFFLCTGLPVFLFSLIVYWQMGRSIQRDKEAADAERRHQEMLAAARSGNLNQ